MGAFIVIRHSLLAAALAAGLALPIGAEKATEKRCEGSAIVQGPCIEVTGAIQIANGWPPWLRVASGSKLYGVGPVESEAHPDPVYPESLEPYLDKRVEGTFRLCSLGRSVDVPYLEVPIPLYCMESVRNATYLEGDARRALPVAPR